MRCRFDCSEGFILILLLDLFTWNNWNTRRPHCNSSGHLVAHLLDGFRTWPDPLNVCLGHCTGKICPLREKAKAGVYCICTSGTGDRQNLVLVKVGFANGVPRQFDCLVGQFNKHRTGVILGINGNSLQSSLAAGAKDSTGDFPPVCHQYFADHAKTLILVSNLPGAFRGMRKGLLALR